MRTTKEIGDFYETIALNYYIEKGFSLLERNFRFGKSEIDLIMKKGSLISFVEVKYRSSKLFGHSEEMLSENQKERILSAAEEYLISNNLNELIRFDVVAINSDKEIMLFEDAFG